MADNRQGDVTIADQAHDTLVEENVWQLYDKAQDLWGELYEHGLDYDDPADTAQLLDEIGAAHARLEGLRPAILECASRGSDRREYVRAVAAGEIEPPPEKS